MKKYNISTSLIQVIKNLYNKSTSAVLFNSSIGDLFWTTVGVRQGCLLSPTLFNIFRDRIMTDVLKDHEGTVSIGGRQNNYKPPLRWWQWWLSYNWWGLRAWDILQDSTDNISIDKAEISLEWQEYFSQFKDTNDALPCHIHLPVFFLIMDPHNRAQKKNTSQEMRCYRKILQTSCKDHVTNEEVRAKIPKTSWPS